MAELKTDYKDDVLDASVNEKRLFNIVSSNGTVLFENVSLQDITVYTQNGDTFGAGDVNKQNQKINECFQSVSDGKALVASAITDKRVPTDATATFAQMAENIGKIVLGSGNALPEDVKTGKTFTNDDGVEYTGTYDFSKETVGTASADQITDGFTAWVNGELVVGTRPTPVKSLSGTVQVSVYRTDSGSVRINFSQEFDAIPSISVSKGAEWGASSGGSSDNIKFDGVSAVTSSGFTLLYHGSGNSGANGDYRHCYFNWTAIAK